MRFGLLARSARAGFFEGIALATWFKIAGQFVCLDNVESLQGPLGTVGAKMPRIPVHFTAKFHYSTASSFYGRCLRQTYANEQVGYGRNRYRDYRSSPTSSMR